MTMKSKERRERHGVTDEGTMERIRKKVVDDTAMRLGVSIP